MTGSDVLIVALATLAGPVLAVQAQKWIERSREARIRKLNVFFSLMATRAARLSFEHVRALNMIDIEFYGRAKYQDLLDKWHVYHDHLSEQNIAKERVDAWVEKGDDLFLEMLHAMAIALGYKFDLVKLRRGSYIPRAHGEDEKAQRDIRDSLVAILSGDKPFPITVSSIAQPPGMQERVAGVQELLVECLSGRRPLQVVIQQDGRAVIQRSGS